MEHNGPRTDDGEKHNNLDQEASFSYYYEMSGKIVASKLVNSHRNKANLRPCLKTL